MSQSESEQEAIVSVSFLDNVLFAEELAQPPEEPFNEVSHADGHHWIVRQLVDQIYEADDQDQHVVVQVAVQVPFKCGELYVLVSHQMERHLMRVFVSKRKG